MRPLAMIFMHECAIMRLTLGLDRDFPKFESKFACARSAQKSSKISLPRERSVRISECKIVRVKDPRYGTTLYGSRGGGATSPIPRFTPFDARAHFSI